MRNLLAAEIDWAQTGILGAIAIGVVVAGLKRVWMFKWTHDEIVKGYQAQIDQIKAERDLERSARKEWQTIALTQAGVLEHAVQTVTETVRTVSPPGRPEGLT